MVNGWQIIGLLFLTKLSGQSKRNEKKMRIFHLLPFRLYSSFKDQMILISKLPPNERDAWYECMINHAYEAEDWENARQLLVRLLKKDKKRAEEMAILSYVSCCAEAVSATLPLPDFSSTLEDFYLRYGMESAENI